MLLLGGRGSRHTTVLVRSLAFGAIGVLAPSAAHAHFKINAPTSWMSQDSIGGPQKNGPCAAVPNTALGDSVGTPTNTVTVLQSGQTLPVSVTATVAHPGWFRIAMVEGASSTQTLSTLPDPQAQAGTNCTPAIVKNPVWSPTQPVIADGLPAGSTASTQQTGTQTFQITIPKSASCTSTQPCTLQVIMVMTDHPASDCYYHHCADISIASAADAGSDSSSPDGPVMKDAANRSLDAIAFDSSGGSGGDGVGAGTGGVIGSGGSMGLGGSIGRDGSSGTGALTGMGGSAGASGSVGAGDGGETGGSAGPGSGGSAGSGGGVEGSGVTQRGGNSGAGGLIGSGGSGSAMTGTETGSPVKSAAGCGCDLSSRGGSSWGMTAAMLGAMAALRGRRRRR
jgi:hypothetical protein